MTKMRSVIFVRGYLSEYDSRMQKYFRALDARKRPYQFIGWEKRSESRIPSGRHFGILYRDGARLGGGFRNILWGCLWNVFVLRTLMKSRSAIDVIHAVDLDSIVSCYIFARLFRKKIIFDVYDNYAAVRSLDGKIATFINSIEAYFLRHSDLAIIAAEERRAQHGLSDYRGPLLVLENVPGTSKQTASDFPNFYGRWKFGYFGVLEEKNRGLEDLLQLAIDNPQIELHVIGYGQLERVFRDAAENYDNIVYYGPAD